MKLIYLTLCLVCCAIFSTLIPACQVAGQEQSALFRQVFYSDSLYVPTEADTFTFRKVILGQEMATVKGLETPFRPQHDDGYGLGYEIFLNEQSVLLLDYYSGQASYNQDRLVSIVADLILQDEVETARMYAELEDYLNERYGLSDGSYEKQIWKGYTAFTNNMEVRLVLNENKRQIGINFIDLQTPQTNPLFQTPENDSLSQPE
ncbi:MAG: hypothetical protein AAF927_30405 [Bacteroidota bacterium]